MVGSQGSEEDGKGPGEGVEAVVLERFLLLLLLCDCHLKGHIRFV